MTTNKYVLLKPWLKWQFLGTENLDVSMTDASVQVNSLLDLNQRVNVIDLIATENNLKVLTGLPSYLVLDKLESLVTEVMPKQGHHGTSLLDTRARIVLVMTKLKTALSYTCLSIFFQISPTTCQRIFKETLLVLEHVLNPVIEWSSKEEVSRSMPRCFDKYKKVRAVLDCTEIEIEKPKCLNCRILTYSYYYSTNTIKVMISVSPAGVINYISKAYGGRASDKAIFEESGLLDKLEPFLDDVMGDKGFRIEQECLEHGIGLVGPPFSKKAKQLSKMDSIETAKIARARVHVERKIQRMKIFGILKTKFMWSMAPFADSIFTVIAGVVNLSPLILADDKF